MLKNKLTQKVYELYMVVRTELGLNQFLILLAQRTLQPPVLILYWSFLFSAQVGAKVGTAYVRKKTRTF